MIYLLCFIGALNIVLLIEIIGLHMKEQEGRGLVISYGKTFLLYSILVVFLTLLVHLLVQSLGII